METKELTKDLFSEIKKETFTPLDTVLENTKTGEPFAEKINLESVNNFLSKGAPKPVTKITEQSLHNQNLPFQNIPQSDLPKPLNTSFLSAEFVIRIADLILSSSGAFAFRKITNVEIKASEFALSKDEIKILEEPTKECLKKWNIQASPEAQLLIAVLGIYGAKVMTAVDKNEVALSEQKAAKKAGVKMETTKTNETRGRHKKDCVCPICTQKKSKKNE